MVRLCAVCTCLNNMLWKLCLKDVQLQKKIVFMWQMRWFLNPHERRFVIGRGRLKNRKYWNFEFANLEFDNWFCTSIFTSSPTDLVLSNIFLWKKQHKHIDSNMTMMVVIFILNASTLLSCWVSNGGILSSTSCHCCINDGHLVASNRKKIRAIELQT